MNLASLIVLVFLFNLSTSKNAPPILMTAIEEELQQMSSNDDELVLAHVVSENRMPFLTIFEDRVLTTFSNPHLVHNRFFVTEKETSRKFFQMILTKMKSTGPVGSGNSQMKERCISINSDVISVEDTIKSLETNIHPIKSTYNRQTQIVHWWVRLQCAPVSSRRPEMKFGILF